MKLLIFMVLIIFSPCFCFAANGKPVEISAQIEVDSQLIEGLPNDPKRCIAVAFIQIYEHASAKSYQVVFQDSLATPGAQVDYVSGGPFPDDDYAFGPARFLAPPGTHRWALAEFSSGQGCDQAESELTDRYSVLRAEALTNKKIVYKRCELRAKPKSRPLTEEERHTGEYVGKTGSIVEIERRVGIVRVSTDEFSNQPLARFFWGSNDIIVETEQGAIAEIRGVEGGPAYLLGPRTRIRLSPGGEVEILKVTPKSGIENVPKRRRKQYEVRTPNCVLSARG